jgi:hypothetical protein
LYHFNQLGAIDRALRLATDIVTQQVRQQAAAAAIQPAPPADAPIAPPAAHPHPAQVAQPPPATELTAVLTSLSAQLGSLTTIVQAQAVELAAIKAAQLAATLPALLPPPPAALLHALPPAVQPPAPAAQSSPPPMPASVPIHRQRALAASPAALSNLFDALEVDSDDDVKEDKEVSAHSTQPATALALTSTDIFPPSLAPPPLGSGEDGTQQLARLLSSFQKTTVKYHTLAELAEAIDDWYAAASKAQWPPSKLKAIYQYRHFVIDTIGRQSTLAHAVKYHTLFAKAVQALDHDLFAPRGYFDAVSYVSVFPNSDAKSTSPSASADRKKGKKGKKATAGAAPAEKAKVFPAGSCINHLTSTTHDTSMCNKGK